MTAQIADFVANNPSAACGSGHLWQDPEARVFLVAHDEARGIALQVCSLALELFPDADVTQCVMSDPEDGRDRLLLSVAFKAAEHSARVAEFYERLPATVNSSDGLVDVSVFKAR